MSDRERKRAQEALKRANQIGRWAPPPLTIEQQLANTEVRAATLESDNQRLRAAIQDAKLLASGGISVMGEIGDDDEDAYMRRISDVLERALAGEPRASAGYVEPNTESAWDDMDRYDQWARSPAGVAYIKRLETQRCLSICSAHRDRAAGCQQCHVVVFDEEAAGSSGDADEPWYRQPCWKCGHLCNLHSMTSERGWWCESIDGCDCKANGLPEHMMAELIRANSKAVGRGEAEA